LLYPTGNPGYIFKTKTEKNGEEGKAETFREYLKNKLLFQPPMKLIVRTMVVTFLKEA
jgi:hypothetical protein